MRNILIILLVWCPLITQAQNFKLNSRIVYYSINDSLIEIDKPFSIEEYNSNGELVYELKYPYPSRHLSEFRLFQQIGTSKNYQNIWCVEGDSMITTYLHDTLNGYNYIINEPDTSMKYMAEYFNGLLQSEQCLYGCKYTRLYKYNNFNLVDSIIDINENQDSSYTLYKYDSLGRFTYQLYYTPGLDNRPYISTKYDDVNNIKTEEYGNENWTDFKQIVTIHLDDNLLPIRKEFITINYENTTKQIMMYSKLE